MRHPKNEPHVAAEREGGRGLGGPDSGISNISPVCQSTERHITDSKVFFDSLKTCRVPWMAQKATATPHSCLSAVASSFSTLHCPQQTVIPHMQSNFTLFSEKQ